MGSKKSNLVENAGVTNDSQKFIPLSVPNLSGNELEYVTHAVKTAWVSTGGPYVNDFEN
jgi:dTDP-4-amino-4,6-dideoxygalactose transaminase